MTIPLPVVKTPRLRQSSLSDLRSCPRKFLLRHRCNLKRKGFIYSKALSVGAFFHEYMAVLQQGEPLFAAGDAVDREVNEQVQEALEAGKDAELVRDDLLKADALGRALATVYWEIFPLDLQRYKVIRVEDVVRNAWGEGIRDVVILDQERKEAWLGEHKTEGEDGLLRATPLTFEMQPRFYQMLEPVLDGYPLVGVMHNIIVKPNIVFGQKDRPFQEVTRILKSGPRKGQEITERVYGDDPPQYDLYLKRCRDWLLAEGEYSLEKDARTLNPTIVQSWVRFSDKNDVELVEEIDDARELAGHGSLSTGDPAKDWDWEASYPRHDNACRAHHRLCEFMDLCTSDPATWPSLVETYYEQRKEDIRYANG